MSASDLLGGLPERQHGPNYLAKRFAILTGRHTCYKCGQTTRVSAIGLAGYDEWDDEDDLSRPSDGGILLTQVTALNKGAAGAVVVHAPWLRLGHSHTADASYLANHCEHCDTLIGAWFISKPGEAFFPLSDEETEQLTITWIDQSIELEDLGGAQASWIDRLLGCDRPSAARRRKRG
ncbi:hypothetical protein CKY51_18835 [Xanthomonas maliensis]|nr:hypothetical protein CKY51_18835 [Xanthomonas maliensis]